MWLCNEHSNISLARKLVSVCVCMEACESWAFASFANSQRLCTQTMAGDKFQFTSNENPIVYTSALIVINSRMVTEWGAIEMGKKRQTPETAQMKQVPC